MQTDVGVAPPASTPRVSVIIGTYNGASRLPNALRALSRQSFKDFEIVVVDDGSTDETAAVAAQPTVRLISLDRNRGHGHALNVALREARGPIVAMMDDDCVPPPSWLEDLVSSWSEVDAHTTMVGGTVLPLATDTLNRRYVAYRMPLGPQEIELDEGAGILTRLRFAFAPPMDRTEKRVVFYGVGANLSLRTAAALEVGGFPEVRGFGEEEAVVRKLRRRFGPETAWFDPTVLMYHDYNPKLDDTFRRARIYGWSAGRNWAAKGGIPSLRPRPLAALGLSGVILVASPLASLVTLFVSPLLLYRRWVSTLARRRSFEVLLYPYIHFVEELAGNLGFVRGSLDESRRKRAAANGVLDTDSSAE